LAFLDWSSMNLYDDGNWLVEPLPEVTLKVILAYLRLLIGLLSQGELLLFFLIFCKLVWEKKFIFLLRIGVFDSV
jgi:hypothetical protein